MYVVKPLHPKTTCVSPAEEKKKRINYNNSIYEKYLADGVLSPLLFILLMNKCMTEICTNDDKEITMVYANDVAVITEIQTGLQEAIDIWQKGTRRKGLQINGKKNETMNVLRNREECIINLNKQQLKQFNKFCYMRLLFTQDNIQEREVKEIIRKYNVNLDLLYPLSK